MALTIFNITQGREDYPFEAISPEALADLRSACSRVFSTSVHSQQKYRTRILLQCFECYLQVTNQQLSSRTLSAPAFKSIAQQFVGAIYSDFFKNENLSWKYSRTRDWFEILNQLGLDNIIIKIPQTKLSQIAIGDEIQTWIKQFRLSVLNQEKVWIWNGWVLKNRNGRTHNLLLYPMYLRLGKEFTQRFFETCDQYFRTRKATEMPCIHLLAIFIRQYPGELTSEQFLQPEFSGRFWRDFFVFYVKTSYANGNGQKISNIITKWHSPFVTFIKKYLIGSGLFAEPWGALPCAEKHYVPGAHSNISTTAEGHVVKTKLLTHIPLHVSDEDALNLLFNQIESDLNCIVTWSEWCCAEIWNRYQRRLELAPQGTPRRIQSRSGVKDGSIAWLNDRTNPEYLANAAATFAHYGYLPGKDVDIAKLYPSSANTIAHELALPITDALLPHCILLVAEHPAITPSFLKDLKLFDKNGKQTGYAKTDGGYKLIGYKHRRGSNLSQQTIDLTHRTAEIVQQVIAITQPLRDYLRSRGDDQWRYLLLTCQQGFAYPSHYNTISMGICNSLRRNRIVESLGNTSKLTVDERQNLVKRLNLSSIRASAGVLVYLKTQSADEMSKALGHAKYDVQLLDHYLPRPLMDFFQERWVRIFQNGIVVETMKDSPYLLEATDFKSMDELHEFLSHHALRLIPQHLISDVDNLGTNIPYSKSEVSNKEVVFGMNAGVLTAMISLEMAVEKSIARACAKSKYWAGITGCLVKYIEKERLSRPDLFRYLEIARTHANPSAMEALIYAA